MNGPRGPRQGCGVRAAGTNERQQTHCFQQRAQSHWVLFHAITYWGNNLLCFLCVITMPKVSQKIRFQRCGQGRQNELEQRLSSNQTSNRRSGNSFQGKRLPY